jgi:hypothetical protein
VQVLEFLKNRPIEDLRTEFGIESKWNGDLVILNYDMIKSIPHKTHPIVRECRGLVLRKVGEGFVIAQMPFPRFFNIMETDDTDRFDWDYFCAEEKLDGSMIKVTDAPDQLLITTRNSFADSEMGFSGITWRLAVQGLLTGSQWDVIAGNPNITFVFELCTPWNVVVVPHTESKLVLTGLFDHELGEELDAYSAKDLKCNFKLPEVYPFTSQDEVHAHLARLRDAKDVMEGFVLRDANNLRLKVKNEFHIELHRLSNNGNIASTKSLVSVISKGEKDEVSAYFPHLRHRLKEVDDAIEAEFGELYKFFQDRGLGDIEDQKAFALEVVGKTPYSHALFMWKRDKDRGLWPIFLNDENTILDRVTARLGESGDDK